MEDRISEFEDKVDVLEKPDDDKEKTVQMEYEITLVFHEKIKPTNHGYSRRRDAS
jgi:hypothetical protein